MTKGLTRRVHAIWSHRPLPSRRTIVFLIALAYFWNITGAVYYAASDDIFYAPPTGWTATYGGSSTLVGGTQAAMHDGDDATYGDEYGFDCHFGTGYNGGCGFGAQYTGTGSFTVRSFRAVFQVIQYGCCGGPPTGGVFTELRVECSSNGGSPSTVWTQSGGGDFLPHTLDRFNLTTPCVINNAGFIRFIVFVTVDGGWGGPKVRMSSVEGWLTDAAPPTPIANYVRGLNVSQIGTGVVMTWTWAQSFSGTTTVTPRTWTYTNGTTVASTMVDGKLDGSAGALCSTSSGSCSGPWTLTVTDAGRGLHASIVIPANANGEVLGDITQPGISGLSGCYNATANQCGASQSAGTLNVTYALKLNPQGTMGDVAMGPEDMNQGSIVGSPPPYVAYGKVTGVYPVVGIAAPATGPWLITVSDAGGYASVQFVVPTAGGSFVGQGTVGAGGGFSAVCDPSDVGCAVRNVPGQIAGAIGDMLVKLVRPGDGTMQAYNDLQAALALHEPFSTIGAVKDKITVAVSHGTSSSFSCLDMDLHMAPGRPAVSTPIHACFSILTGASAWPTIRTLMGMAVYAESLLIVWGWVQGRPDTSGRLTYRDDVLAGDPT